METIILSTNWKSQCWKRLLFCPDHDA